MDKVNRIRNGISIHALHEESDAPFSTICATESVFQSTLSMRRATRTIRGMQDSLLFQSTLSMRRATPRTLKRYGSTYISIHALHEESDPIFDENYRAKLFQSTLSMRRAT